MEVFIHATFYGGIPFTRAAIDAANEIFRAKGLGITIAILPARYPGAGFMPALRLLDMTFQSTSEILVSSPELEDFRFDWSALPAATDGLAGTGGRTLVCVGDFVVSEVPRCLPSGDGEYAYAYVEKRNLNTQDLIAALRERGVPYNAVGVAGLKDKHAVTRQWLSVPAQFSGHLESLDELDGVRVLETSRHGEGLGRGRLRGNRFEARVREPDSGWQARGNAIIERLRTVGLPNYFGPQRYGRFNSNAIDGVRMLRGEKVPGGRRLNEFFISALQSHLFNWNLKGRIEQGMYDRVFTGDRARRHDTGGMFLVGDGVMESERARRLEISAALPLYGRKVCRRAGGRGSARRGNLAAVRTATQRLQAPYARGVADQPCLPGRCFIQSLP